MSDPPLHAQVEVTEQTQTSEQDEVDLVQDGYVTVRTVQHGWANWLDPWQANAVKALTNPTSLTHPEHPLRLPGEDGLTLYNCVSSDKREKLCFSLKQLEYLQLFIHEARLADPAWTMYLAKLQSANAEDQPDDHQPLEPPPYVEEENPWIPLPRGIFRASEFETIEPLTIVSGQDLKRTLNIQQKHNKAIDRQELKMQPMTPEEAAKIAAVEDNEREGPGLRKGPARERQERKFDWARDDNAPQEGTGWGGFPVQKQNDSDVQISDPPFHTAQPQLDEAGTGEQLQHLETSEAIPFDAVQDDPAPERSLPADTANNPASNADSEQASTSNHASDIPLVDHLVQYHYDAQQAYYLALAGGLAHALAEKEADEDSSAENAGAQEDEEARPPKEIGRSLFFALDLTTWEEDESVVLEVGWSAVWWQEKVAKQEGQDEKVTSEKAEDEMCNSRFERMTESGHIIVQNHLLDKRNGQTKPEERNNYIFGSSIPLQSGEVHRTVKQALYDLSKRAGGGPIYILIHSPDGDETELKKLGWKTAGWERDIRPKGWEFPSYSAAEGTGKVFVLDTAKLFGAIENDKSVLPAAGKSRKSLQQVARTMFGHDHERELVGFGNAGNDAAYCLQVFLAIVDGPPLDVLREDYRLSQEAITIKPNEVAESATLDARDVPSAEEIRRGPASVALHETGVPIVDDDGATRSVAGMPVTPTPQTPPRRPARIIAEDEDDEPDSDQEAAGIKGVFWENEEGEDIELV